MQRLLFLYLGIGLLLSWPIFGHAATPIIHDAEYYILDAQNGEKWAAEDKVLDQKLAELKKKNGGKPLAGLGILTDKFQGAFLRFRVHLVETFI